MLNGLFGRTGAGIITILLLIVVFMITTGISVNAVYGLFKRLINGISSRRAERIASRGDDDFDTDDDRPPVSAGRRDDGVTAEISVRPRKNKKIDDIPIGSTPVPPPVMDHELPDDSFPYDFIDPESLEKPEPFKTEPPKPDFPDGSYRDLDNDDLIAIFNRKHGIETPVPEKKEMPVETVPKEAEPEQKPKKSADDKKEENKPEIKEPEAKPKSKRYRKPPIDCLMLPDKSAARQDQNEIDINSEKLIKTLKSFGVEARIIDVYRGPTVTRYELQPAEGVKISKITNLADDIALRLAASGVRIEAPIPNKAAIGIEVPNKTKSMVSLREIIDTPKFKTAKSKLNVALGKDITGNIICADLAKMPHLLIAGTTGSGKSVCLNTMIISILYNATPEEVKLLMIDPKQVEFMIYNGIPHLEIPVVSDPKKAAGALSWAVSEMLKRYKLFSEKNVRNITGYNNLADTVEGMERMSQFVIFIDELSDLMMAAPDEVEDSICRLAQMARAAGMHLVIATQRPSVNVITGVIKANIPSRISLSVSSQIDSRTIIDMAGAEKLLGNGDMLFNPVDISKPLRVQGCYVSEEEVENVVTFLKNQSDGVEYNSDVMEEIEKNAQTMGNKKNSSVSSTAAVEADGDSDEMLPKAIEVVVEAQMASTTLLQRKLKLGYARAARLVDELEERKIVGPFEGSKPRKVLITKQQWMEMNALSSDVPDHTDDPFDDPSEGDNYE
ncbi:MAG: DNA translocase FtsK [Clostridiales bacterium]|nr:DNA translocase FtsK [Clostridiales bacterium]